MTIGLHPRKAAGGRRKARPASRPGAGKPRKARRGSAVAHPTDRDPRSEFSDEEWHDMVATAAYYRAEARGFEGGSPDEDWFEAEAQLREQLSLAEDEADDKAESGLDLTAHKLESETESKE